MDQRSVLDLNSLCIAILSLPNGTDSKEEPFEGYFEFLEEIQLPIYQTQEIKQIERSMQIDSPIFYTLEDHKYSFRFYPNILEKAVSDHKCYRKNSTAATFFAMHSFLSWYILYEKCFICDTEYLPLLVELLGRISVECLLECNENEVLSVSAFYYCYSALFSTENDNNNMPSLVSLFCGYMPEFSKYISYDFVVIIEKISYSIFADSSMDSKCLTGLAKQIVESIIKISQSTNNSMITDIVDKLVTQMSNYLFHLDETALKLLERSSDKIVVCFIETVLCSVIELVDDGVFYDNREYEEEINVNFSSDNSAFKAAKESFDGIDPKIYMRRRKHKKEKINNDISMINIDIKNKMDLVANVFANKTGCTQLFENIFAEKILASKKITFSHLFCYLYISNIIAKETDVKLNTELVYNSLIFPSAFISNEEKDCNTDVIRFLAVEDILLGCRDNIVSILHSAASCPYKFTEMISIMILFLHQTYEASVLEQFIPGIFEPYLFYRSLEDVSEEELVAVSIANENIVSMFYLILSDPGSIFESYKITKYFYSLFYDENTQDFALSVLNNYLTGNENISQNFLKVTQEFLDSLFDCSNDFNWINVALNVIGVINSFVAVSVPLAQQFAYLTEGLCSDISKLQSITINKKDKTYASVDVLMNVVSFLAFTSHGHSIRVKEIFAVEAAINRLTCNNPTNEIKDKLVHIIAGRPLSFILPNFEIRQPKVLGLFVRVFLKTDKISDILKFLIQLCSGSEENCKNCQKGYFDIFLVDLIDEWREHGNQKQEIVDLTLKLLITISCFVTSPIVVQRFISLLAPVDGIHLPYFYGNIITALNQMLIATMKIPSAYLILDSKSSVQVTGLKDTDFSESFTFAFWIFYHPQEGVFEQEIFSVSDNNQHSFSITLSNNSITADIESNEQSYTGSSRLPLKLREWNYVTLSYKRDKRGPLMNSVIVSLNGDHVKSVSRFGVIPLKPGSVNVFINSAPDNGKNTAQDGMKLSSFALYNKILTRDEINTAYDNGPCSSFNINSKVFSSEPKQTNGILVMKTNAIRPDIRCKCNIKYAKTDQTFAIVLVDACNVESIIPIFSQIDLVDKHNEHSLLQEEIAVDIVKNVLSLNEAAQISFSEVGGFKAIAYLLMSINPIHLTYQFYTRFYSLIQVITVSKLLYELYDSIILNIDIWIRAPAAIHHRIIKNWARVVFQTEDNVAHNIRPFSWFYFILRYYYWTEPKEENLIIKERCNGEKVPILECRKYIFEIMKNYLFNDFHEEEFRMFIINISTTQDLHQAISLLGFLGSIATSSDFPEKIKNELYKNIEILTNLLSEDIPLNVMLFEIFALVHNCCEGAKKNFPTFAFCLLKKIKKEYVTVNFIQVLKQKINEGYTEFLPVALWAAINSSSEPEEVIKSVVEELSLNMEYNFDYFSLIYPVLILFFVKERKVCIKFLVSRFSKSYDEVSFLINIFGRSLNMVEESLHIQSEFIAEMLSSMKTTDIKTNSFNLAFQFILFRQIPKSNHEYFLSLAMSKLFADNYFFYNSDPPVTLYDKKTLIKTPEQLYKLIDSVEWDFNFGLRLDEDGNWKDAELVKIIITELIPIYSKVAGLANRLNEILLLLGFLVKKEISVVENFFSSNPTAFTKNGLCFIRHKMKKYGITSDIIPSHNLSDADEAIYAFIFIDDVSLRSPCFCSSEKDFGNSLTETIYGLLNQKEKEIKGDDELEEIRSKVSINQQENMASWVSMWRSMTLERAPWNSALPPSSRKLIRFKRDNCTCSSFCPYKLRRNFNFDNHKEASLCRDLGDTNIVKQEMEKQKMKRVSSVIDLPEYIVDNQNTDKDQTKFNYSKSSFSVPCSIVSVKETTDATMFLFKNMIVIKKLKGKTTKRIVIQKKEIRHLFYRTYRQKLTAIEIFVKGKRSYFLCLDAPFQSTVSQIYSILGLQSTPKNFFQNADFKTFFLSTGITEKWVNNEISNFDYIMYLNIFSGRSFNCPSQYPIFPWIISNYDADEIDLTDKSNFRNLSKPVGALNQEKIDLLFEKYIDLVESEMTPYLYSSAYSNPLTVFLYLMRMEPFTTLHIDMQNGKFDQASRIFKSIKETYDLVLTQPSDFRELTPEFFFMPEFLMNLNEFDLGKFEEKEINDVKLPKWAEDCYEFIYINRKALESECVSSSISEWIDLIWGCKQKSMSSYNLFKPELYPDVWEMAKDSDDFAFNEANINILLDQIGQIPQQLFTDPHPYRTILSEEERIGRKSRTVKEIKFEFEIEKISASSSSHILTLFVANKDVKYIERYTFDLSNIYNSQQDHIFDVIPATNGKKISKEKMSGKLIALENNFCAFLEEDQQHIQKMLIPSKQISNIELHVEVASWALDGPWSVVTGNDATLSIYKDASIYKIVRTYRNSITYIALSKHFDEIVVGTKDNSLIFCSLSRGNITSVVDLAKGFYIRSILITESMGFVLVDCAYPVDGVIQHVIMLYNINGNFMRKLEIPFEISCWSTGKNNSGFDFVLVADSAGIIHYFEAFYVNKGMTPIFDCKKEVVSLRIIAEESLVAAACKDGSVFLIPI